MEPELKNPETEEKNVKRGYFLDTLFQGFLILLPLTIVLILLSFVFNFIFKIVSPISFMLDSGADEPHWSINFLSIGILALFIFIIGALIRNKLGKRYFSSFEKKYLTKVPLYSLIHQTVYQFVGLKKLPFSDVVLIDPFKTGTLMTGFVTDKINEDLYTIFVPTAPNPTNGNIYHVPKNAITFLNVQTQDAMRTIMGMGTGTCGLIASAGENFVSTCSEESKKQLDPELSVN
ncbi:DUF502 domain-containing protein [Algoriphagus sp. H41]|uniref:DUF502 domain-containing protein n=1 Tax=Algoriphagus oliviformis TaxID=2811231 RepID=A0ABS3C3G8_9BACT|nr:DUF502 domain-containing protein [Algoriphagus oliviformis]MBN7810700.1 DUF502 domain-containing protein [Algoriphagus oliviformis]